MIKNDENVMPDETIARALEGIRARITRAEQERAALDRVVSSAREEERLLEGLLALRQGKPVAPEIAIAEEHGPELAPKGAEKRHPAISAVIEELAAAGRPVHISELMRLLQTRRVSIPGAGTQANLITHLRRDARLVRPSRGMYALATSGLENMPKGRRKGRRKRVRVKARAERTDV